MKILEKRIKEIAQNLDCGLKCYLNKKNGKMLFILEDLEYADVDEELYGEEMQALEENFNDYIEIDPMDSHQSYGVMWEFAESLADRRFSDKLQAILNGRKPFRRFKDEIDDSEYREKWFAYKLASYEAYVKECIQHEIEGYEAED